jgi:hypothetical protein
MGYTNIETVNKGETNYSLKEDQKNVILDISPNN